jgi:molecular chaperone HscB
MNDPFNTLGIEARFDLDMSMVEKRHRDLSRTLHPDRYSGAPAAERRMALGRAIEVNEAIRLLRDPIRRAEALLRHAGVPMGEMTEPKPSNDLLMEMMDSREMLADAARKKDAPAIKALEISMRGQQDAVLAALAAGFLAAAGDVETLKSLLPKLGELRYLRRFLDEVSAIEEELVPGYGTA